MSSSEDDDDVFALVLLNNVEKARQFWVHPLWLKKGQKYGIFDVMKELNIYPERFQTFYRLSQRCHIGESKRQAEKEKHKLEGSYLSGRKDVDNPDVCT